MRKAKTTIQRKLTTVSVAIVLAVWLVYNRFSPPNLLISVGFHYFILLYGIVTFTALVISGLRKGPETGRRHAEIRFWSSNIIYGLIVLICLYFSSLLIQDTRVVWERGFPSGRFVVMAWRPNRSGFLVSQDVDLVNLDDGTHLTASYNFRTDVLRWHQRYRMVYGPYSRFIFLATPISP